MERRQARELTCAAIYRQSREIYMQDERWRELLSSENETYSLYIFIKCLTDSIILSAKQMSLAEATVLVLSKLKK